MAPGADLMPGGAPGALASLGADLGQLGISSWCPIRCSHCRAGQSGPSFIKADSLAAHGGPSPTGMSLSWCLRLIRDQQGWQNDWALPLIASVLMASIREQLGTEHVRVLRVGRHTVALLTAAHLACTAGGRNRAAAHHPAWSVAALLGGPFRLGADTRNRGRGWELRGQLYSCSDYARHVGGTLAILFPLWVLA
jgi:hypothetical protein